MLVATHGNKEIAELLLKRGANPYLQDKVSNVIDKTCLIDNDSYTFFTYRMDLLH